MTNEKKPPAAAPDALQAFTDCPEWGQGGQFIYDPVSKTRTRVGEAPAAAGTLHADFQSVAVDAAVTAPAQAGDAAMAETAPGGAGTPAAAETVASAKKERTRA